MHQIPTHEHAGAPGLTDAQAALIARRLGNQDARDPLGALARNGNITAHTALALREALSEATSDPERSQAPEVCDMRALIDYIEDAGPRNSLPGWGD
jgi:hypothetical protein